MHRPSRLPPTSWRLDELAHAGPEHLEAAYAEAFDEKSPTDFAETVADLVTLGLDRSSTVLDLGGGTGAFAIAVAPFAKRVIAADISPAMVAVAQRRVAALGLANVEVVEGGFLSYEHRGDPADFVHTRNTLHQIPDFWKVLALRHIHGLLRPGGVLYLQDLVFSFSPADAESAIDAWLRGASNDSASGWTAAEYVVHLREEYSTFAWQLESMLERTGFEILESWFSPSGIYAAYECRRR